MNLQFWKQARPLLWMLAIPALGVIYTLSNRAGLNVYSLATTMDDKTPFVPAFVLPYSLWYPFLAAVLIGLFRKDPRLYFRTLSALCLGLVTCYVIYFVFQTTVSRPEVPPGPGWSSALLRFVYANDMPYNCFPSIHVLTSYLMIKSFRPFGRWARCLILLVGTAIIVSTVMIKQHVIADVAAGILLAEIVYLIADWALRQTLFRSQGDAREGYALSEDR
ncbi:phosphatase PAP2 family protein [Cohnella nanjingensis]|uniref:Phosphatase PAP2 family protein n=1 Tax=Cohnella nanjingensis TaxID=1387779 RepID=A0A7X0RKY2_9BACL|nr:phosphatase PAP2 family protein [Cohnella nanjingensis]MBB6669261.1 phosphatase PAP2 family protein [Cohnella nanjingensis]